MDLKLLCITCIMPALVDKDCYHLMWMYAETMFFERDEMKSKSVFKRDLKASQSDAEFIMSTYRVLHHDLISSQGRAFCLRHKYKVVLGIQVITIIADQFSTMLSSNHLYILPVFSSQRWYSCKNVAFKCLAPSASSWQRCQGLLDLLQTFHKRSDHTG